MERIHSHIIVTSSGNPGYKGWTKHGRNRNRLVGKVMTAGFEDAKEFQIRREAMIRQKYDVDGVRMRILNGDGAEWIRGTCDPEIIYQLDRFHIQREITRKIRHKKAQTQIRGLLDAGKATECLEFIDAYATSIEGADMGDSCRARELLSYLKNNEDGLLPYHKRGLKLPAAPEGLEYRNLGTQESNNCSAITLRMKHRKASWSIKGATHLAKILVRKENRTLYEALERHTDGVLPEGMSKEILEPLSAAKAPKHDGGKVKDAHVRKGHIGYREAARTESRNAFLRRFDLRPFSELIYR
ncbi:UPF0236 family transposase-like protein [Anaerotalea alkaliphila]|uniref:Transposase n=1 Tax=Anaerotalea alkaliphila TaxID=2662126 RepID=A0A7X5KN89_9FIRM|nr:UPF0236 family protein [Anaerotalea alkaliphila]NDL67784.1 hypothetical protein [Anaerotalea alkaliphila]